MCGIAGILSPTQSAIEAALSRMVCAQSHRGPDDAGEQLIAFGDGSLGLGHRRLSILDLSMLGHQPMIHPDTADSLIFNGEIYNFRALRRSLQAQGEQFRSNSDTEVLLRGLSLHGPDFLKSLQGMYALAFYNHRRRSLLLARDPMGIKPLYIGRSGSTLVFASEVRAVLASGLIADDLDSDGIAGMLAFGAVQHPHTIYANIQSFPPAHYQVFHANTSMPIETTRFWSYPTINYSISEDDAIAEIETTLDAAVRDHLESDVPVGVFLSSGLDSTAIAALAVKHSPAVRSFTVGFSDQPDMSELGLARETAELFGLDHTEVLINGDTAVDSTVRWLEAIDQPSFDGLNVFVISAAVREHGIKVALSGQGGDELFGGYPSFADVPRMHRWMRYFGVLPQPVRVGLGHLATSGRSAAVRQKMKDVMRTDGSIRELYLQRRRVMSSSQLRQLGISESAIASQSDVVIAQDPLGAQFEDGIALISQLESSLYQGNMLLRDGDATGMAHGLEIRIPMLDQRMLDLMHALPGRVRLPDGIENKHLLRRALASHFRPSLLTQPKRGFTLPIRRWMVGPLREICEHALTELKKHEIFNPQGIEALWQSFLREPESPMWTRVFSLCVLGMQIGKKPSFGIRGQHQDRQAR